MSTDKNFGLYSVTFNDSQSQSMWTRDLSQELSGSFKIDNLKSTFIPQTHDQQLCVLAELTSDMHKSVSELSITQNLSNPIPQEFMTKLTDIYTDSKLKIK